MHSSSELGQHKSETEEEPLVAQAFMFFVTNWGCFNVTGFLSFYAEYNTEAAEDAMIATNQNHELLKELSTLAQNELEEEKLIRQAT